MEIDKLITANELSNISSSNYLDEESAQSLKNIIDQCIVEAKNGKYGCYMEGYYKDKILTELNTLGYKTERHHSPRNEQYLHVRWGK